MSHLVVAVVYERTAHCDQPAQQLSQAEKSRRELLETLLQEALAGQSRQAESRP